MRTVRPAAKPIPITRLDGEQPERVALLLEEIARVARSSAFTLGAEVAAFEEEFAAYCGTRHAVGVASGTDALQLALRALEIGPSDEVIVPANTFIATAEAVALAGAIPRFVDVDPHSALVTPDTVAAALTTRTRAVIPVHLYGRTADIDGILEVVRPFGIPVIEDACQAHGAFLGGRRAGSVGACGCFSFYPSKNLGAWGDGGAIVTDDDAIADTARLLRAHGERRRYHHSIQGTTSRLDAIQAAILRVKLTELDAVNERRRDRAETLDARLSGAPVVTPEPAPPNGDHVYHQYVVRTERRDELREHLAAAGVGSAIHYPVPLHRTPAFAAADASGAGSLPVCEELARTSCSLPMHPALTSVEVEQVAFAVHGFAEASFAA
jgi:dTDP-3-amino-3,4,6-trideoxy-alpha-D-glucose transaminase